MVRAVALSTICTLVALSAGSAQAQDQQAASNPISHVRGGILIHDVDSLWSGSREEEGFDLNLELLFHPFAHLWSGSVRPTLGVNLNTAGDTSHIYSNVLWEVANDEGWFFNVGLGAAWHNGRKETRPGEDKKQLGSRFLFHVPIEAGYSFGERHSISLLFQHLSNAGLADENEGMDNIGLRYGYRF